VRTNETQTFVWEPGRTADPSAALGMTKGKAALPCTAANQTLDREEGTFWSAYFATTIYGSVTLPFVIPSAAEGSAVRPGSRTKVCVSLVLTHPLKALSLIL
jgi:hypothetical protein